MNDLACAGQTRLSDRVTAVTVTQAVCHVEGSPTISGAKPPPMKECPTCKGSGLDRWNNACKTCGGLGQVPAK